MSPRLAVIAAVLLAACSAPADDDALPANGDTADMSAPDVLMNHSCPGEIGPQANGEQTAGGTGDCEFIMVLAEPTIVELSATDTVTVDGEQDETNWVAPRVLSGEHTVAITAEADWTLTVLTHGSPVAEIDRERSLVWIDATLLDDPTFAGLDRLMTAAGAGENPGELFAHWLRRFATTAHSERVGPQRFLEDIEASQGAVPGAWDLDELPFVVTAVHNRSDLQNDSSCGELRVSLSSTHPEYQPFHAIFLFDQVPRSGDISPDGHVHCGETLRRWAGLSELDQDGFHEAARTMLDENLTAETFLLAETVEFIISPWEWRQWLPTPTDAGPLQRVFENPPLFQTIDISRLNQQGATRDAFLQFVEENASELDARTMLLPDSFRAPSARMNAGIPWIPVDLAGVDPTVLGQFPDLRRNIEIVGCPACHSADAEFVQTRTDRTFSPFYDKELDARAVHLDQAHRGVAVSAPFGPLQPMPILTP